MKKTPHQTIVIGLSAMLYVCASAHGTTVMATLNSEDRIIGGRQSGGDPLGYYPDSQLTVGVAGGDPNRVNTNTVIGFTLPTLNPGESLSAATFSITVGGSSGSNFTVALFGLTTENPDDSGTDFFSQSGVGVDGVSTLISSTFTSTAASPGSIPSSDVSTFLQSFYVGNVPVQSEVFFRLNQTTALAINNTRRMTFTKDTATLTVTSIPEPGAALLGGLGTLILLRRRRNI